MPYKLKRENSKWFVFDNADIKVPSHGFKTKKQARKQEIAVILSQSKRLNKPVSYFFDKQK
jgi:hypothetical protein